MSGVAASADALSAAGVPTSASLYAQFGWHVYVASWLSWWQWLVLIGVIFYFLHRAIVAIIRRHQESVYWNWDNGGDDVTLARDVINTDVDALSFPPDFLFGVATSAHQIEGGDGGLNQWSAWETQRDPKLNQPRIRDGSRVGTGGQHWLRVDEDVKLLKELGVNSYRFSIEWSKVQPAADQWNSAALQHYSDEVDQLLASGIVPMITLQHFTIPLWFEELGGFEVEDNQRYFVAYAERMFRTFRGRVQLWVTINEPFFYSFNGYMSGVFPPGKTSPALCGLVLRNLLEAHVGAYQRIKDIMSTEPEPAKDEGVRIGIVHCIYHFDCWNPLNGFDHFISRHLNHLFNQAVLQFFATGDYHWKPVGHPHTHYSNRAAVNCLDFVGLNYHSHSFVRYRFKSFFTRNPIEIMLPHTSLTLMSDATNACIYPEGLYRSLMQLKEALPNTDVFVTENGIADRADDRRHLYLRRHMYALSLALAHGARVKGYFFWTLFDCWEWHEGHTLKFGLFALDKRTQKRTLRDGSKYYQQICQRWAKKQIRGTAAAGAASVSPVAAAGMSLAAAPSPSPSPPPSAHVVSHGGSSAAAAAGAVAQQAYDAVYGQGHVDRHQPRGSAGSGMLGSQLILRY